MLNIQLSSKAREYIISQTRYYTFEKKSIQTAKAFRQEMKEALQAIQKSPTIFKRSPINPNTFIYTENRFNTYIFYSVESDCIQVIDIKGQAQINEYM